MMALSGRLQLTQRAQSLVGAPLSDAISLHWSLAWYLPRCSAKISMVSTMLYT